MKLVRKLWSFQSPSSSHLYLDVLILCSRLGFTVLLKDTSAGRALSKKVTWVWFSVLRDKSLLTHWGTLPLHSVLPFLQLEKSVKQGQISFHTLALLTFGWQLLSWHMCNMLLSRILATTAKLTVHRQRGHSVDLCDSLVIGKKISCGRAKAKAIFRSWGEYIEVKRTSFFPHIHFTWGLVSNTFIMSEQRPHNSSWHSPEYWFPELSWCIHAIVTIHVAALGWSQ